MSAFAWKSRVVVITGASAGIGAALVHEVGARGGQVVLMARRADKLEEVARAAGEGHLVAPGDVTHREDVERVAAAAIARFGHVDVWVNNAGRGITRGVLELTDDDLDAMIRDNVKSVLYGMQAIVPRFKEQRHGHLINVSSMLARVPWAPFRSGYSAAKAAMTSLGETLRTDLAKDFPEVRVTSVFPGVVSTEFGISALGGGPDSRSFPGGQTAQEVATVLAEVIERRRGGDVYTRPEGLDRVLAHLRGQAEGT